MKPLQPDERIIAIVPEIASGPGFYNEPLWVHIEDRQGKMRCECFQPEEQTSGMRVLFKTFVTVYDAMFREVRIEMEKKEILVHG